MNDNISNLTKNSKIKNMFCIDAPANVENMDNFLKCCGGLKNVEETFKNSRERLKFKFRPEDPNSIPMFSDRRTSNDLAVKVRRKKKPDGSFDYKFETYGLIDTTFHFNNTICDMQLLPTSSDIRNEFFKSNFILNCDTDFNLNEESNTLLKHFFYSRFTTPKSTFAQMRKDIANTDSISHIRKSRQVVGLFIKWEDEIPEQIPEDVTNLYNGKMFDEEFVNKIKQLFEQRPIWSKHALLTMLKCKKQILKHSLPLLAYYYENGPFRGLWVRYGYNPKKEKSSKIYQIVEVRHRFPSQETVSQYKISLFRDNSDSYRHDIIGIHNEDNENKEDNEKSSFVFRPGHISMFKRTSFQICDIEMDSVQEIVHENDDNETECTEKDGWCSKGAIDRMRILMNSALNETLKDPTITEKLTQQDIECDDIEVSEVYDSFID